MSPSNLAPSGVLLGCLLVSAPIPAAAQVPALEPSPISDSVRADLLAFLKSYYDAFSDRDWTRFAAHFWPGATITTVWQPSGEPQARVTVTTVPEFVRQAPEGPGSREIFEERMLGAELHVHGNLAQAFVRYRARFGDPADVAEWEGIDSFALMQHEGEWRIVALSFAADE